MSPASAYPRFRDAEMARRGAALDAVMAEREVAHALVFGANRSGSAIGWPVLGTRSRQLAAVPDFTFARGMTVVVQPNVVTPDGSAGVQTGELLLVVDDGAQRLHSYQRGLLHAPRALSPPPGRV